MPHRPQSANRLTERVHAAVRSVVSSANVTNLLIACSGGADSTCLAHAAAAVRRQGTWLVTIAHVQHGIRPGDDVDLRAARALAEDLGVAFTSATLQWDATQRTKSEERLRARRYDALARMANAVDAQAVLTGHTMDDQAETVLLHLIRGAGLDGLAGMQSCTALPIATDVRLIRPLLTIQRAETEEYCAAHGLPVVHDPSNDDEAMARNWVRHTVLPELRTRNPNITPTLARAAASLSNDAVFMREETMRALGRCGHQSDEGVSTLDYSAFVREPAALRLRMLRHLFERHTGHGPRADDLSRADKALASPHASRVMQFGSVACRATNGTIHIGLPADILAPLAPAPQER